MQRRGCHRGSLAVSVSPRRGFLRNRYFLAEVNVLDSIEERDAILHRALERLSSTDEPSASRALVDNRCEDRLC